jgi:hypothetical protein
MRLPIGELNAYMTQMPRTVIVAIVAFFGVVKPTDSMAQGLCSEGPATNKLVCVLPLLFSSTFVGGIDLPNGQLFVANSQQVPAGLSNAVAAVGTELTSLHLASPASGVIFLFDRTLAVVKRSTDSYGSILGERAETIGRHRIFVAATYQFFPFSTLDGIDLKHIPAGYTPLFADRFNPDGSLRQPTDPPSPGDPTPELEYISTTNRIDLKVHQFTLYVTYGLTNRVDVSAEVPILNVRLGTSSTATIVRTFDTIAQGQPLQQAYIASPNSLPGILYPATGPIFSNCAANLTCTGYFNYFDSNNPTTSITKMFFTSRTASGIGDVVFRVKGTLFEGERAAAGLGLDVRMRSGDEENFLGSGGFGIKPFVVVSYRALISPHLNIGYQYNGRSVLAGDLFGETLGGTTGKLPDQLFYSCGADARIIKSLTLAVDLLGEHLYRAPGVKRGPFVDVAGTSHPDVPQTTATLRSFNMNDLAVGGKYSLHGNLLLTGNVQFKLDDGGLRARVVPLVGVSYTF